jgi:hypothetical protein
MAGGIRTSGNPPWRRRRTGCYALFSGAGKLAPGRDGHQANRNSRSIDMKLSKRALLAGLALSVLGAAAPAAMAHHGWSWAESEQMTLQGTVEQVQIAPPHPTLKVRAADGVWLVELGNPSQTKEAGFVEGSAKPGDAITAVGNRDQDAANKRMKAVQVKVGGKTYDIYPSRIKKP